VKRRSRLLSHTVASKRPQPFCHREAFLHALEEYYNKLDKSHLQIKTKDDYEQLVAFLKGPGPKDLSVFS
jgi:hypothetical protein